MDSFANFSDKKIIENTLYAQNNILNFMLQKW